MEKINQQQVWEKIAKPWQKFRNKPFPIVIEFLKNKTGKILDLGCGSGRHFLKLKNLKIYGVDFSDEMLKLAEKHAKQKNLNIILKKAFSERLPFEDNFFDSAIFIATLHCIRTASARKKALQELFRVLKLKANALITVWSKNQKRVKNKPKECFIPWTVNGKKYKRYTYIYDKEELEALLKKIGFRIVKSWEDKNINVVVEK